MTAVEDPVRGGEIGRPRPRVEDRRLITGAGRYVEDIHLPGALHLAMVRCPYPHARIVRVDAAAAREAPGVRAVLVGAEVPPVTRLPIIPGAADLRVPPFEPLGATVVRAVGMPVAAVVADTRGRAADAAALVEVEYE